MRWFVAVLFLVACGSDSKPTTPPSPPSPPSPPALVCSIGALPGTWRLHYVEVNGDCGTPADETIIGISPGGGAGCVTNSRHFSADQCRVDVAFVCPTTDNKGTQSWVIALVEESATFVDGTGTAQVNHPVLGVCRSTYNLTLTKI